VRFAETRNSQLAVWLLGIAMLTAATASAQDSKDARPLSSARPSYELTGRVPYLLSSVRSGVLAIIDPLAGDLVFLDESAKILERVPFPDGIVPDRLFEEKERIVYIDVTGTVAVALSRDVRIPGPPVDALKRVAVPAAELRLRWSPGPKPQPLVPITRGGKVIDVKLEPSEGRRIANAELLGTDACGNTYARLDELAASDDGKIDVRVNVARLGQTGRLESKTQIPLEGMHSIPEGFADVSNDGTLWIAITRSDGTKIRKVPFEGKRVRPCIVRDGSGAADVDEEPPGQTAAGERSVPSLVEYEAEDPDAETATADVEAAEPGPPTKRTEIIARALRFLELKWELSSANWEKWKTEGKPPKKTKLEIENECAKDKKKYWRRPTNLGSADPGEGGRTISAMPYKWGGGDTPESFLRKLREGKLAGDVCTCRQKVHGYCIVPQSAGIDCSGFVSAAWGISKLGTWQLDDVADTVTNLYDAKPGDALINPGHHVILVRERMPGPDLKFRTIESTIELSCQGICQRVRGVAAFRGYRLIRYKSAVD
jgi:hypothetical protein